jgi:ferritin-like protein
VPWIAASEVASPRCRRRAADGRSLRRDRASRGAEGLTPEELEAVTRRRRTIAHVATEEMLHVALVQNVLSAIVRRRI